MKIKRLLIGMLACSAMVACTNDDLLENNENQVNGKADAYLAVRILDANGSESRATSDGGYDYSTTEHTISTAHFYFYDENGKYVTFATADLTPNINGKNETTTVEAVTNSVLVLKNLTSTGFPKYVVAVLNQPKSYENKNLAELQDELSSSVTVGGTKNGENYIMVNATATKVGSGGKYFATEIAADKFLKEPKNADELTAANTVNIYVERLAAKVKTTSNAAYDLGNDFNIDGTDGKVLKARIDGWGLNATNKKSYIIKKVHSDFTIAEETRNDNTTKVGAWNYSSADLYRSWWAQSPNYNGGTYPVSYASGQYSESFDAGLLKDDYSLDYITYAGLNINSGGVGYCAENTNTRAQLITGNFHAKATEVLLKAVVVDEKNNPVDLYRYDNTLYSAKGYLERLFNKAEGINVYKLEGTEYKAISSEDVFDFTAEGADFDEMLVNKGDGKVIVKPFETLVGEVENWYIKGNDGNYTLITNIADNSETTENESKTVEEQVLEKVNSAFTAIFNKEADPDNTAYAYAYHYNDGMMYYNVPIEHYRTNTSSTVYDANGNVDVVEGEYGIVRNHYYQLTINSISKLGAAVHDATEEIVPDADENVTYCVGATINILSWKVVNQSVDL